VRNVDFLVRLVKYLANETGNLISARGIGKFLKSQNISISITAILNYMNYLTTAMLISAVQRSDIQGKKVFEVGEKYYFNDIGLRNSIAGFSPFDLGQIIENIVYLHLKSTGYYVLIGKQNDREIDFIAERSGEKMYIIFLNLKINSMKKMLFLLLLLSACLITKHAVAQQTVTISKKEYEEKVQAIWLAQMLGVIMGWQFEHKPASVEWVDQFPQSYEFAPMDDDWFYEMVALNALEKYGIELTSEQLGKQWVENSAGTWGSSEQARLNVERGIDSPESGHPRYNRLWFTMGNQARGELPGMMNPGMPNAAAEWARKLGRVNSYAEGTDGGIWVAGMISLAFIEDDFRKIVKESINLLDPATPHHKCITQVITMAEAGHSFREIVDHVEDIWHIEYPASNNTVANAGIVAASVWFGEGDYLKTINLAYSAADFVDTDNNAAISGAIVAANKGLNALPENLVAQLNNRVKGEFVGPVKLTPPVDETITNLAKRTVAVAEKIMNKNKVLIKNDNYAITTQKTTPIEAELWKLSDFTQYWNPSWSLERASFGAPGGGVRNLRGGTYLIDNVLVTYPRDEVRGVVLRGDFEVKENDILKLRVASDPGRAWDLLIYINNERFFKETIDGGAILKWEEMPPLSYPESEFVAFKEARQFKDFELSLEKFKGQKVHIRLYQYTLLLNKIPGNAYWQTAIIEEKK
jgi:hypothetical protein